jgi:hypothetical protein
VPLDQGPGPSLARRSAATTLCQPAPTLRRGPPADAAASLARVGRRPSAPHQVSIQDVAVACARAQVACVKRQTDLASLLAGRGAAPLDLRGAHAGSVPAGAHTVARRVRLPLCSRPTNKQRRDASQKRARKTRKCSAKAGGTVGAASRARGLAPGRRAPQALAWVCHQMLGGPARTRRAGCLVRPARTSTSLLRTEAAARRPKSGRGAGALLGPRAVPDPSTRHH